MRKRKIRSGGQAIVLVTLSLMAMSGMMGLSVDLGWSYFVQRQAQAAVDAGALAAVHEVFSRKLGSVSGLGCSATSSECRTALSHCASISATSNLYNGCQYAQSWDGFGPEEISVISNIGSAVPTPPTVGIPTANIAYWATYIATKNIPQLFSSLLGNTQGTIAAKGTAAIIAEVVPGSFLGMNQAGDCQTDSGGGAINCGVDLDVAGSGKGQCFDSAGNATQQASICGPAGIFLASQCNGNNSAGCGSSDYAGQTHKGGATVWGSTNRIQGVGAVDDPSAWTPTPINGSGGSQFQDPTKGEIQPPIAPGLPSGTAITSCAVTTTSLPNSVLGPFQYYHVNSQGKADGLQLSLGSGTTFASNGSCPSGGTSNQVGQAFPAYVFYGGVNADAVNTTNGKTFGPGQYVMAGTTSQSGAVFTSTKGTFTGDTNSGTMFILTDPTYPSLVQPPAISTAITAGLTFYQGDTYFKNISGNLTGISSTLPGTASSLDQYGGTLFWQDRRNTSLTASGHYDAMGNYVSGACTTATCGATATSPNFTLDHGNAGMTMKGVLYQPRGAWMTINAGGAAVANSPLQVITGSLVFTTGGGNTNVVLLGPTNPAIIFRTALIQ